MINLVHIALDALLHPMTKLSTLPQHVADGITRVLSTHVERFTDKLAGRSAVHQHALRIFRVVSNSDALLKVMHQHWRPIDTPDAADAGTYTRILHATLNVIFKQ